jgi:hypothetical protein
VSPSSSDKNDTRAPTEPFLASSGPTQQQAEISAEPAGSRTADIFSFYEIDGDKKKCKFCM